MNVVVRDGDECQSAGRSKSATCWRSTKIVRAAAGDRRGPDRKLIAERSSYERLLLVSDVEQDVGRNESVRRGSLTQHVAVGRDYGDVHCSDYSNLTMKNPQEYKAMVYGHWPNPSDPRSVAASNTENADLLAAIGKAQAVIEFEMDGTILTANDNFLRPSATRWTKSRAGITACSSRRACVIRPSIASSGPD